MDTEPAVLTVGAGIAGLALARTLAWRGISSLTLEARGRGSAGLALNLPGNAVRALHDLGLAEGLARIGMPIARREYRTERGRLLFAVDEAEFWRGTAAPMAVRRAALMDLLLEGLPDGAVRFGTRVASIEAGGAGRTTVSATLADGTTIVPRFLVGADGVGSGVRRAVIAQDGRGRAVLASASWRFLAPNPGIRCWTLWAGRHAMILLLPLPDGEAYGWATTTRDRATDDPGQLATLFCGFPDPVRAVMDHLVARPDALHRSPLEEVRLDRWSEGRAVLIGDAAHATAPVWAQGAAMAVEDALVLAELLNETADWDAVPARFEQRRRPRVDHVADMTDRMSKAARLPGALRNLLVPFIGPKNYQRTYEPLKARP